MSLLRRSYSSKKQLVVNINDFTRGRIKYSGLACQTLYILGSDGQSKVSALFADTLQNIPGEWFVSGDINDAEVQVVVTSGSFSAGSSGFGAGNWLNFNSGDLYYIVETTGGVNQTRSCAFTVTIRDKNSLTELDSGDIVITAQTSTGDEP